MNGNGRLYSNAQIIGRLFRDGEPIENYRLYLIAQKYFARRSGIFSLDEMLNLLHETYDVKSLHTGPGNKRGEYRTKYREALNDSLIFTPLPDGRYRVKSSRRIFNGIGRNSTRLEIFDCDMKSWRAFRDAVIGVLMIGEMKSYRRIAELTGFKMDTIYRAAKRNHETGRVIKSHNLVICHHGTREAVEYLRQELWREDKVNTPKAVSYMNKGVKGYALAVYAPNSYSTGIVEEGQKGTPRCAVPQLTPVKKDRGITVQRLTLPNPRFQKSCLFRVAFGERRYWRRHTTLVMERETGREAFSVPLVRFLEFWKGHSITLGDYIDRVCHAV